MIITQAPFRISFFGGGTDFPGFFLKHGGQVLSTTIDKYCYLTVRHLPPFFEYSNSIVYSQIERIKHVDEIEHPAVREAMKYLDMHELSIVYDADLPARTGLGTSSSFAVAMLLAFHSLKGKYADKKRLADEAIYLERVLCREKGGVQDQIAAAFGGLNKIVFSSAGYEVQPVVVSDKNKATLEDDLMLFFTGISRYSFTIQEEQEKNLEIKNQQLLRMKDLVDEAEMALEQGRVDDFGRLLDVEWKLKREINGKVSNPVIDEYYSQAMEAGALGGKLLGAGGGGFLLLHVPKDKQPVVRQALSGLLEIPFHFEAGGAKVLYYSPEVYIPKEERDHVNEAEH